MLTAKKYFNPREWGFWRVFGLCFITAAVLYLPYVVMDGGLFHYAGDFNSQQINFYQYTNAFVKNGGVFSWETDLGSGFVNSYSFYLVGSPFWWLSLLLPSRVMPFMMVPFVCLKIALSGSGAWLWAKRYCKGSEWAVLTGVLYAFSGFTLYNVFFNHFVDVIALFPYLLWALDETIHEGRRGWLAALVALNFINNYFFFVGEIVFLFIYFFCKWSAKEFRLTGKLFFTLAFESLLGCAMGCLLAWPALLSLANNPRTVNMADGYGWLLYSKPQQYAAILSSLFIMPDAPYLLNMWTEGTIKWTSMTAYLPLAGCAGVLTWLRGRSGTWKRILYTCLLFALVPGLNSLFIAFNSSYYARWFYMPVLVMALCTAKGLEEELDQNWGAVVTGAVCAAHIALALVPNYDKELEVTRMGVLEEPLRFWLLLLVTVGGIMGYILVWRLYKGKAQLPVVMLAAVLVFTLLYGNVHISITKMNQWELDANFAQQCYREGPVLEEYFKEKGHFFRTDSYEAYDNISLWDKTPCIRFFNSTVAPSILHFYPQVGVTRDVNSKPEYKLFALRGLLSVEYMLVPLESEEAWQEENLQGWVRTDEVGSYAVWQNENYVPMGFAYDRYITKAEMEGTPTSNRANLMMKALLLTEEQIEKYGDILSPLTESERGKRTYNDYVKDCEARRAAACSSFTAEKDGFTASITLEQPRLVFFSVPYDDGFTATVNGQAAEIEEVDNGLMAVLAPAGENEIVFTYRTPGLAQSGAVTLAAIAVYLIYLVLCRKKRGSEPDALPPLPHGGAAEKTMTHMEEQ